MARLTTDQQVLQDRIIVLKSLIKEIELSEDTGLLLDSQMNQMQVYSATLARTLTQLQNSLKGP